MNPKLELYKLLAAWIEAAPTLDEEGATPFRNEFNRLVVEAFGTPLLGDNPEGMLYDKTRNNLLQYSVDKNDIWLEGAKENFEQIPKPAEN